MSCTWPARSGPKALDQCLQCRTGYQWLTPVSSRNGPRLELSPDSSQWLGRRMILGRCSPRGVSRPPTGGRDPKSPCVSMSQEHDSRVGISGGESYGYSEGAYAPMGRMATRSAHMSMGTPMGPLPLNAGGSRRRWVPRDLQLNRNVPPRADRSRHATHRCRT